MKQELRCHAVLCPREERAREMAEKLQDRLHRALVDFRKEKISRQNARLSLANSIHENPSMPYRKLLLQTGTCNYKPPIERSKSAPKLTSIEEAELEEEEFGEDGSDECIARMADYAKVTAEVHSEPPLMLGHCSAMFSAVSSSPRLPREGEAVIMFEEDNSDEEDEIKDYIGGEGGQEADSCAASESPASQGRTARSSSPASCSAAAPPTDPDCHSLSDSVGTLARLRGSCDQDTISDESGYSEEPLAGPQHKEVTVVKVNLSSGETPAGCGQEFLQDPDIESLVTNTHKLEIQLVDSSAPAGPVLRSRPVTQAWTQPINIEVDSQFSACSSQESSPRDSVETSGSPALPLSSPPPNPTSPTELILSSSPHSPLSSSPRSTDLSVKSVLLSEFTSSEKLRYIERSNLKASKNATMVLNRQGFCINI